MGYEQRLKAAQDRTNRAREEHRNAEEVLKAAMREEREADRALLEYQLRTEMGKRPQ